MRTFFTLLLLSFYIFVLDIVCTQTLWWCCGQIKSLFKDIYGVRVLVFPLVIDDDDAHKFICHCAKYGDDFLAGVPVAQTREQTRAPFIVVELCHSIRQFDYYGDLLPIVVLFSSGVQCATPRFSHYRHTLENCVCVMFFCWPFFSRQMAFLAL